MITRTRLFLGMLALALPAWALSQTADPVPGRHSGRVLILRNHRALEGEIERVGEQYRVRRATGELLLPADRVLCVCADWDEALALVCRQANLHDPDERLRVAKWCQMNGRLSEALAHAAEASRMRPDHAESKYLVTVLERAAESAKRAPAAGGLTEESEPPPPALDLSAESLRTFTSRIQPILMNTCANCHSGGRGGKFQLTRCTDAAVNRRGLQQNVAAVLAQVNFERTALSPLLIKAVSDHSGASKSPLPDRDSKLFKTLQEWVETTAANNPHLKQIFAKQGSQAVAGSPRPLDPPPAKVAPPARPGVAPVVSTERPAPPAEVGSGETVPAVPPAAATTPDDEYGEAIFNRQFHPPK